MAKQAETEGGDKVVAQGEKVLVIDGSEAQRRAENRINELKDIKHIKKTLAEAPKVRIRLPLGDDKTPVSVNINGYPFIIKRGVAVDVPQHVYDTLLEAGYIDGVERQMHTHEVRASMGLESVGNPDTHPAGQA